MELTAVVGETRVAGLSPAEVALADERLVLETTIRLYADTVSQCDRGRVPSASVTAGWKAVTVGLDAYRNAAGRLGAESMRAALDGAR